MAVARPPSQNVVGRARWREFLVMLVFLISSAFATHTHTHTHTHENIFCNFFLSCRLTVLHQFHVRNNRNKCSHAYFGQWRLSPLKSMYLIHHPPETYFSEWLLSFSLISYIKLGQFTEEELYVTLKKSYKQKIFPEVSKTWKFD